MCLFLWVTNCGSGQVSSTFLSVSWAQGLACRVGPTSAQPLGAPGRWWPCLSRLHLWLQSQGKAVWSRVGDRNGHRQDLKLRGSRPHCPDLPLRTYRPCLPSRCDRNGSWELVPGHNRTWALRVPQVPDQWGALRERVRRHPPPRPRPPRPLT